MQGPFISSCTSSYTRLQLLFNSRVVCLGECLSLHHSFGELVHTERTFAAAAPMLEHFNSLRIRGNPSFASSALQFWPALRHGWRFPPSLHPAPPIPLYSLAAHGQQPHLTSTSFIFPNIPVRSHRTVRGPKRREL